MQVVVLAGGVGSRLRPWTATVPKPLLPVLDKTLLEHVVSSLPIDLVDDVVVAGGYRVDQIKATLTPLTHRLTCASCPKTSHWEPAGPSATVGMS